MLVHLLHLRMYRKVGWIMEWLTASHYAMYFIATVAVLLYFTFCIATTWFFTKIVLKALPDGRGKNDEGKNDEPIKVSEGETSKTPKGSE